MLALAHAHGVLMDANKNKYLPGWHADSHRLGTRFARLYLVIEPNVSVNLISSDNAEYYSLATISKKLEKLALRAHREVGFGHSFGDIGRIMQPVTRYDNQLRGGFNYDVQLRVRA